MRQKSHTLPDISRPPRNRCYANPRTLRLGLGSVNKKSFYSDFVHVRHVLSLNPVDPVAVLVTINFFEILVAVSGKRGPTSQKREIRTEPARLFVALF